MNSVCCSFTHCQSFLNLCHHQVVGQYQSATLNDQTSSILKFRRLSIKIWSIWLCIFPSGDVQVNSRVLQCGDIVLLIFRCGEVYYSNSIFITLSFLVVPLAMSSLPTSALKSPNKILVWYFGNLSNACSSSS
jgi:hypothetical protein